MSTPGAAERLRIVFFISSYCSPQQLHRLVRTLRKAEPASPIVVHHDPGGALVDASLFQGIDDVYLIVGDDAIAWGDMTLETARWRMYRWILDHLEVDWVVLLSEQDYPIRPLSELRRRLAEAHVDAFIRGRLVHEVWDARQRREWERRYFYQYRWSLPRVNFGDWVPTGWRQRISKWRHRFYFALGGMQPRFAVYAMPDGFGQPSRLGLRPRSTPFGPDFPCWIVDSWYALSRKAMEHVVEFVRAHPEVAHYYEHTVIPVESATGTIVDELDRIVL
jgi:hypothetical protein